MINLPEDVAGRLYAIYSATLTNPVPLDEMVLTDQAQWAYSKGKVKPEQQLSWIRNLHRRNADLDEPYDVGVLNALEIAMFIFASDERFPEFADKPEYKDLLQEVVDKANKRAKALAKKAGDLQKNLRDSKTVAVKIKEKHASELKKLKKTTDAYKKELVICKSSLKTASVVV